MERPEKQTAVRLPIEMYERLRQSSGSGGVSEEIRRRLQRSFTEDALDPITRELASGVVNLAADVQRDLGAPWHEYGEFHSVFAAALAERLAAYKPARQASGVVELLREMGLSGPAASQLPQAPDVLGAMIERTDRRIHSYEHLQAKAALRPRRGGLTGRGFGLITRKPKDKD